MKGSSVTIITLEEATNGTTNTGRRQQQHQAGPSTSEQSADADVVSNDAMTESNNLCNDFLSKINFQDARSKGWDADEKCDEEVQHQTDLYCRDECDNSCSDTSATIRISDDTDKHENIRFICDLGYGLPNEVRPRKEKIYAIAKQLVTFLSWQAHQRQQLRYPVAAMYIILGKTTQQLPNCTTDELDVFKRSTDMAVATVPKTTKNNGSVGSVNIHRQDDDESKLIHDTLLSRMHEVWDKLSTTDPLPPFPENDITFSYQPLDVFLQSCDEITTGDQHVQHNDTVYLSPDATHILDTTKPPPRNIIIGLLIDRRTIQYNRSVLRAQEHHIHAVRWPIENIMTNRCFIPQMIHKNEPLNVDCVLEGMQQWYWNIMAHAAEHRKPADSLPAGADIPSTTNPRIYRHSFEMAAIQAIQHHVVRHPQRPLHKT